MVLTFTKENVNFQFKNSLDRTVTLVNPYMETNDNDTRKFGSRFHGKLPVKRAHDIKNHDILKQILGKYGIILSNISLW